MIAYYYNESLDETKIVKQLTFIRRTQCMIQYAQYTI